MNEYITKKGNTIYWKIDYNLGGYSYATNKEMKRGYYLSVRRSPNEFMAYQGLEHPLGAVRMFIHEVTRQSVKQENIALNKVENKLIDIINRYSL